ncbi:hypothetical protein RS030_4554 [Cryptosporidium xiaoi]|uniref:Uncharacterized protein n=1 Tax=Cryptosporidium xiaoi TaxID=659607 RepID=A0AAV9XW50_9CRYT
MQKRCINKRKIQIVNSNNNNENNRWPTNVDNTILISFSRNVVSKEIEYMEEARRYMRKLEVKDFSNLELNYLLSRINDKYPSESFLSKLMVNPDSILFLYNIIKTLLKNKGDVNVIIFAIQDLCRSLIKHKSYLSNINRKVENKLVRLSMKLTEYIQTIYPENDKLTTLMNTCTCLLSILSSNSYYYFSNTINNIEKNSNRTIVQCENGVASLNNKDINYPSYPFLKLNLELDDDLLYKSNDKFDFGSFISNIKYLGSVVNIYKFINERPTLLSPNKKSDIENLILLLSINVLSLLDNMINIYFNVNKEDENKIKRSNFSNYILPLLVELFLKWISISEEINLKRISEYSMDSCFISMFPKTMELITLSIYNDSISNEITRIIIDFLSSYSNYLTVANKNSIHIINVSKKLFISSLIISNSLNSSSKYLKGLNYSSKDSNWFKVLTKYFQIFSSTISPLLVLYDLLGIPLNFEINEDKIDCSNYLLYKEWIYTLNYGAIDIIFETINRYSSIIKNNKLNYDIPTTLIPEINIYTTENKKNNHSQNRNIDYNNDLDSNSKYSVIIKELLSLDFVVDDNYTKRTKIIINENNFHRILSKYRNNIYNLYSYLSYMIINDSKKYTSSSVLAWESLSYSIKLSSLCVDYLQSFISKMSLNKYKSLYKYIIKKNESNKHTLKCPDINEIGFVNMVRYFVWSVVSLGEFPCELYTNGDEINDKSISRSERRLIHLKTRENIRDIVRNTIFFPVYSNYDKTNKDNSSNFNYFNYFNYRNNISYSLPLYSFQLYLRDIFLKLNGYNLTFDRKKNKILMLNRNTNNKYVNLNLFEKNFIIRLEAILHAFSAIIKRGSVTFLSQGNNKDKSNILYKNDYEIDYLLQYVNNWLNSSKDITFYFNNISDSSSESCNIYSKKNLLNSRFYVNNIKSNKISNEKKYFEFTRLLFDAIVLKIFKLMEEMDNHINYYLFRNNNSSQINSTNNYHNYHNHDDEEFEIYKRLFRQLLCTLITLIGVNSNWFTDKSIKIYKKSFYYIFKSLKLPQEDLYFPLSLEQDHVGTLALLKLSQHEASSNNSDIINYLIFNCVDLLENLFSNDRNDVNIPTMTLESYLILIVSSGICISHFVDKDRNIDRCHYYNNEDECGILNWKKYVNIILNKYMLLLDNLIIILNTLVENDEIWNLDELSRKLYNVLFVIYLLICGLEIFISSIFPSKYRPYSFILLTIGADKFDNLNMLEYCGRLFLNRKAGENDKYVYYINDICDYITSIFIHNHYLKVKLILDITLKISPIWFLIIYHPYTSLLSCVIQLPNECITCESNNSMCDYLVFDSVNRFNISTEDTSDKSIHFNSDKSKSLSYMNNGKNCFTKNSKEDLLLEIYNYIGFDECEFLKNRMGKSCLEKDQSNNISYGCGCDYNISYLRGSGLIGKKGIHPIITLIYRYLSFEGTRIDPHYYSRKHNCADTNVGNNYNQSSSNNKNFIDLFKDNFYIGKYDYNKVNCVCNAIPNITLPLSVMMMKITYINECNKSKYIKPILSCIYSLNLFDINPIMSYLSLFSINPVGSINTNTQNHGDYLNLIYSNNDGENYFNLIRDSGSQCLDRLILLCNDMKKESVIPIEGNNYCTCFEYNDLLCSILVLFLNNLTNIKDYGDANSNYNKLSIVGSSVYFDIDSFMEYIISRCTLTLLICIGIQNSNVIDIKRKITLEKNESMVNYKENNIPVYNYLKSYDDFYYDMSLSSVLRINSNSEFDYSSDPNNNNNCFLCGQNGSGIVINNNTDGEIKIRDIIDDLMNIIDEDYCINGMNIRNKINNKLNIKNHFSRDCFTCKEYSGIEYDNNIINNNHGQNNLNYIKINSNGNLLDLEENQSTCIGGHSNSNTRSYVSTSSILSPKGGIEYGLEINENTSFHNGNISYFSNINLCENSVFNDNQNGGNNKNNISNINTNNCISGNNNQSQNNFNSIGDCKKANTNHFSPLKLITNQRYVITTLKYLLGDFILGKNNKLLILNVFNKTIWGIELISTIFLTLMDPHCDSESFSILSDILILIKQLLDKKEFKKIMELTFLRLPIRLFIQSKIISKEFKSLKYSFNNCGYVNLDIEDYYNCNYYKVNNTNVSKNVDSLVANSINESINLMLKENEFSNKYSIKKNLPHSVKTAYLSDTIKDFIEQLTFVTVTQANKTKFRQIIKEFCTKPSSVK